MMMDDGIKMETIFGDGSQKNSGFLGKILGAGKRILTGESLFMTAFYNTLSGKRNVSFASPYPGKIIPIDLTEFRGKFICQKDAFLCAAKGVSVGIEFSKRLGRGLFGGEGFIMQKLEGDGMAFVHAGGTMSKKVLQAGEILKVDTGCIVGFTQDVDYDIEFVGGIRGLGELEKRVNSEEMKVAFALYPVSMQQLVDISDNNMIMPPKVTWFEPKLRSGLFVHDLKD